MTNKMTVNYDVISDTLYVDACPPYDEQTSNEIEPGVVARFNPSNATIENLEVMFFKERFEQGKPFELPVSLDMQSLRSA